MAKRIPTDTQKHSVNVLHQVARMRSNKKHCDFVIKVDSEEIPVHRNILSASSDYFDTMFSDPIKKQKSGVVKMMGVNFQCVMICVDHMYGKEVSILPEYYEPLMFVANLMQLHTLCDAIVALLGSNLDSKLLFVARKIANVYGYKNLEEQCVGFSKDNFGLISKEGEFGELDKSFIDIMIKSRNTKITDEEKLDGLLIWINSYSGRRESLSEMVSHIDLSKVSVECRRYMIEKDPQVMQNFELFREFCNSMLNTLNVGTKPIGVASTKVVSTIVIFDANSQHLHCFNPSTNTWKQMHEMNDAMKNVGFSAVTVEDNIYVLMKNKSVYRIKCSDESATWKRVADMNEVHGLCPPATVLSGRIYVIGGHNECLTKCIEIYVPEANQWIVLRDKPQKSKNSDLLSSQGHVYSFGGCFENKYSDEVVRFDPNTSTWSYVTSMEERKGYVSAVEFAGQFYVMGGFAKEGEVIHYSSLSSYDASLNTWTNLKPMSTPRSWFRTFAIDGFIYAIGGLNTSPGSIEAYDIERNNWKMVKIPSGMKLKIVESTKVEMFY